MGLKFFYNKNGSLHVNVTDGKVISIYHAQTHRVGLGETKG